MSSSEKDNSGKSDEEVYSEENSQKRQKAAEDYMTKWGIDYTSKYYDCLP